VQHATQKKVNMTIKEYLESIGRIQPDESAITSNMDESRNDMPSQEESNDGIDYSEQSVGQVFDMLKARYKAFPGNIQINVQGWPGRPFEGKYEPFNHLK
jgi:hypothetical protein